MSKAFPICYERENASKAFEFLVRTKNVELQQVASEIGCPTTGEDWPNKVLLFAYELAKSFENLASNRPSNEDIVQYGNLIGLIAKNKTLHEVQRVQMLAYNIYKDFKALYQQVA